MFNIVLVEPRIPQNTGNIARTCAATGCGLHIVRPTAFEIDDKKLKRAGLDYWQYLDVHYYKNIEEFYEKNEGGEFFYLSTKAPKCYTEIEYPENSYLIFGKESAGIPEEILKKNLDRCVRIPMLEDIRSLNLSNSVAIAVYEVLRQQNFKGLEGEGFLKLLVE